MDLKQDFLKAETAIGITRQKYHKKFIYDPQQYNDNYLLDRLVATPSQLQGFTIDQEKCIGYLMGEITFKAAQSLQLPVSTAVVAASIAHFYFSRVGFLAHDFRDIAMGAMHLACKSEETLRKSYEISAVFDHLFKVFEGQKMPIKLQIFNSEQYVYMKKKVIQSQKHILFELGFQIHRLLDIPHRYIGGLLNIFDKHRQGKSICQKAWTLLNDFYKTNVCLYYPGQIIAAASVYISLLKLNIKMPKVPWWGVLMQANFECIQELNAEMEFFYQMAKANRYTMEWVSQQITAVGEKRGLVNVFPVNYYSKISLDLNRELKIRKIDIIVPEDIPLQIKKAQMEEEKEKSESDGRKRKKKDKRERQKKKDKKNKKDKHKHEERYYSSDSKSVALKDAKNVQQTPIRKESENLNPSPSAAQPDKKENPVVQELKSTKQSAKELLSKLNSQLKQRKKVEPKKQVQQQQSSQIDDSDAEMINELMEKKKMKNEKKPSP